MTVSEISRHVAAHPASVPFLQRVTRHATGKGPMPARIVLGNDPGDPELLAMLNRILSNHCTPENGKYILKLTEPMRDTAAWQLLTEVVGLPAPNISRDETTLATVTAKRLRLLFPDERPLIDTLESDGTLRRFIRSDTTRAAQYLKLFEASISLKHRQAVTLSQLGSDIFNDSKALRSGPLLSELDRILRAANDQPDLDTDALRAACGIIDNPYTSHVTVCAPFSFITDDGACYDFPQHLFQARQAVVLPWETVRRIRSVRIESGQRLVTSENAAPFLRLTENGLPALYTGGYPNTPVRVLLGHFATAGAVVEHFGDTDLDGYRIADQIAGLMPFGGFFRHERLKGLPHKPLTESQRARLAAFIARHPDSRFIRQLQHTLAHGWAEQESSGWWE